ncbi:MAG: S-layer homology domain-containing protein [Oscillospiraceae bacterium]|nr:S-layer homology domain-containing protein [Oscillospiraceae bacterium]
MNNKYTAILLFFVIASAAVLPAAVTFEDIFDDIAYADDYTDERISIGQYDMKDAVLGDVSTYPKDFVTYRVQTYGVKTSPEYINRMVYEDEPVEPDIYIYDERTEKQLEENVDYSIEYVNNDKPGTAYVVIEGMGNYEGFIIYPFIIGKQSDRGESTSVSSRYDDETRDEEKTVNRRKHIYTPFPVLVQTTVPMTPKPSYPPAVPIKKTPTPKPSSTPKITPTPKPTPMPKRVPYVNIFDHNRFMWEYTNGEFGLNMYVSKAELAVIFSGILMDSYDPGEKYTVVYEDVTEDSPFGNYIGFISQYDIIKEKSDKEFEPNKMITRADFAFILSGFTEDNGYSGFIDVPNDYWAKEYIDKVASKGWMTGTDDGRFRPDKFITRGEIAQALVRFLGRDTEETLKIQNLPRFSDVSPDDPLYPYVMAAATYR